MVWSYTMIFALGCIAALFGGLNAAGVVSDKGLQGFWEFAPLLAMIVGIIAAVHYMYKELKAEADYYRTLYEGTIELRSYSN